jgi:hypothetical protein
MDVICLELAHHIGLCYRPVDVADDYLFILIPEEDLELGLLGLTRSQFQDETGLVFTHLQLHLGQHV